MHTIVVLLLQVILIGQNYLKPTHEDIVKKFLCGLAFGSFVAAYLFVTNTKSYEVYDYEQLYRQMGGNKLSLREIQKFFEKKFPETQISFDARDLKEDEKNFL